MKLNGFQMYSLDPNGASVGITVQDAAKVLTMLSSQGHGKETIDDILKMLNRADFQSGKELPLINLL